MRQLLKRFSKMVIGYGAVTWAGPFLSLIFTPIITRILTPSDYGIADYALAVASSISTIIAFAQPQALTTHFNDQNNEIWKKRLTGSALTIAWLIGIPISVMIFGGAAKLAQWTFQDQSYVHLFQIIGLTVVLGVTSSILTSSAQASLRVRWGMLFSITSLIAMVIGNVVFIIILRLGATGMVLTPMVVGVTVSVLAGITMRKNIGMPSFTSIKLLFRSGLLLLPTILSYWVLLVIDRLFLVHYVSTEAMGHYAIANRIASLMTVALNPLTSAWMPLALSIQNEDNAKQQYISVARYLIAAALLASLFLGLFATEILILLTRANYLPAAPYVGFLSYVYVCSIISTILTTGAMVSKQLKGLSISVVGGATINIGLNFLLIPNYGLWGATFATVVGFAVPLIILYVWLDKYNPTPYPLVKLLAVFIVQFSLLAISMLLPPMAFPIRIAIKSVLFLILPCSFILFSVINRSELLHASLFIKNQWKRRTPPSI